MKLPWIAEPIAASSKEPVTLQAILVSGADPKNTLAITTFGLAGQGHDLPEAKDSAIAVILNQLDYYARKGYLIRPEQQLKTEEEVLAYFKSDKILEVPVDTIAVKDETKTIPADRLLPKLIFEFYRLEWVQ